MYFVRAWKAIIFHEKVIWNLIFRVRVRVRGIGHRLVLVVHSSPVLNVMHCIKYGWFSLLAAKNLTKWRRSVKGKCTPS